MIIINIVTLIGRLSKDPEVKTSNNKKYCRFSLAVARPLKKDETDFFNCVAFAKTAELIGEYLRKGQRVGIQGTLQQSTYETNGEKRTSYDVVVNQVEFLENKGNKDNKQTQEIKEHFEDNKKEDWDSDTFPF